MNKINPTTYFRSNLDLDILKMRELEKLSDYKPWLDLVVLYLCTYFLIFLSIAAVNNYSYYFYPLLIFFIAGRQGALLQFVHEASHNLISKNLKLNNFFGSWLTGFLVGVNFRGYTSGHVQHHKHTSTSEEPDSDSEKYVIVDFKNPKIYILFIKDLLGITALKIFFDYGQDNKKKSDIVESLNFKKIFLKISLLVKLSIVQLLILALFKFDIINYILFWLYPAMGPHMFLMRIRGIAEHGLSKKLGKIVKTSNEGLYYTRSFLTNKNTYKYKLINFFEKMLIGSLNVYYHHEHHLNPRIPYYNLPEFHELIFPEIKERIRPEFGAKIYEKGYFSAAFSTVYVPLEELS